MRHTLKCLSVTIVSVVIDRSSVCDDDEDDRSMDVGADG